MPFTGQKQLMGSMGCVASIHGEATGLITPSVVGGLLTHSHSQLNANDLGVTLVLILFFLHCPF